MTAATQTRVRSVTLVAPLPYALAGHTIDSRFVALSLAVG